MTSRHNHPENWSPVPQKLTTRLARQEPRLERVRVSSNSERALRPKPLNIPSKQPIRPGDDNTSYVSRKESGEKHASPREPEIIDVSSSAPWQRKSTPKHRSGGGVSSPSLSSTRQSEISLGILDYYMREPTPVLKSPEIPVPKTPKLDAAMVDKFDFGLPPTPTRTTNGSIETPVLTVAPIRPRAVTRSHTDQALVQFSPQSAQRPSANLNRGYSLFPIIKQVTPPRQPAITVVEPLLLEDLTPPSVPVDIASPPPSTYRPRKESITSSVRTRNDSISSLRITSQRNPIPLRIISCTESPLANPQRTSPTSTSPSSTKALPQVASRWSDDTITSPSLAPTPGPRTSFGSLLRRDSVQFVTSFFEDDDDESVPLRKKFGSWGRKSGRCSFTTEGSRSAVVTRSERKGVREIHEVEEEGAGKGEWWRPWLCGCVGR